MRKFLNLCLLIGILFAVSRAWGFNSSSSTPTESIAVERILEDIRELSHPRFQGRQTGTEGGITSAHYLVNRFHALGLVPAGDPEKQIRESHWFQQQPHTSRQVGNPAIMTISYFDQNLSSSTYSLLPGQDFLPVLDSPATSLTAPLVFVGYGIVDPARGVDHYRGIDVRNRVVLFLRGKPSFYPRWVTHEEKAALAQDHGAAGYLTVTGPILDHYEARKGLGQIPLAIYGATPDIRPIPGAWVHGKVLDRLLQANQESLNSLQQAANEAGNFPSRPLAILTRLHWEGAEVLGTLTNVIGMLPGRDSELRKEVILVGAHRDHFGEQAGLIFPGADDNASGTGVMLELARQLSQRPVKPKRTILFVSFDGEERGLLGSTLYVQNPVLPLNRTIAMINLDHLGAGNGNLTVGMTRMDNSLALEAARQASVGDRVHIYGYFPGGDHVPFYEAGVPTITLVSSGPHPHFHQTSDTFDTVQPELLSPAAHFILALITRLADSS